MKSISPQISEGLYVLIKSLKKSEKRSFKLFINKQNKIDGQNTYLGLFNAIDKQEVYNEQLLLKKLKFSPRKLSYTKHLLYELILKSLRHLHDEQNPNFKLRTLLNNIEILYQKALYRQSYKMLIKAKQLAFDTDNYSYIPDLLRWSSQLFFHIPSIVEQYNMPQLPEEHHKITHKLYQELVLKGVRDAILCFQIKNPVVNTSAEHTHLKLLINHPILKVAPNDLTLQAKMAYYEILGVYHQLTNDLQNACDYYEKLVGLWENKKDFLVSMGYRYSQHIFVFLKLHMITHRDINFEQWFAKLDNAPMANTQENTERSALSLSLKKLYELLYKKELSLENEIEAILNLSPQKDASSFTLNYYLCLVCFSQKKLRKATLHLNNIFYHSHYKLLSTKQKGFIKILELILHYDLDNTMIVDHLHKSVYRFIHKYRKESNFERMVIKYLKKLYNTTDKDTVLLAFKKELQIFPKGAIPWQMFEFEILMNWVKNNAALYNTKGSVIIE